MKRTSVVFLCCLLFALLSCQNKKSENIYRNERESKPTNIGYSLTNTIVLLGIVEQYRTHFGNAIGHEPGFSIKTCLKGNIPIQTIRFIGFNDNLGSSKLMEFEKIKNPTFGDLKTGDKYYLGLEPFLIPEELRQQLYAGKTTEIYIDFDDLKFEKLR